MSESHSTKTPFYLIILLVIAGESVFILPFVLARIFGVTFLETFHLSNFQLGICFSTYGVFALISYLIGGGIADKYKPNQLMGISLVLTAAGGFYMATIPSYSHLILLFGYWGITTIFLFWSPMIKATRLWGGQTSQGKAFGFLDGGRGLVAALVGTAGVIIYSYLIPSPNSITNFDRQAAFKMVIITVSIFIVFIGALIYLFLKFKPDNTEIEKIKKQDILKLIKNPNIIWLMLIVLSAYVGYKITDNFSLYASQVMLFDEVEAAELGTLLLFARPITGIFIGFLADQSKPTLFLLIGFIIMSIGALVFGSGYLIINQTSLFLISTFFTAFGIYSIRALYFAMIQQINIPITHTGTAVGLISFIGFTPDIFVGPIKGHLLDNSPGLLGHQHVFIFLFTFSLLGLFSTYKLRKNTLI